MNLFGITSLMIFFAGLGLGLFLYASHRESKINKSWFILSISISFWGLGLYGVTSTTAASVAMKWQYLLDISAIFIPVTFFAFTCDLLRLKNYLFRKLTLFAGVILAIFSVTPLFKQGVDIKYGFYWINPGHYYIIFPVYFSLIIFVSLILLVRGYFKNKDDLMFRSQIRNTLLAGIFGFGGGITNFFPQVINIYPFGNYFVLLYVFLMSYSVIKHKLLSTKIISAQLFGGAISIVFLFNLLQPDSLTNWLVKFVLFILVSVFSVFFVRGVYREIEDKEKIEKLASELKKVNDGQTSLIHFMNHQIKGRFGITKNIFAELMTDDYGTMPPATLPLLQKGLDEANIGVSYVMGILKGASAESGTLHYDKNPMDLKSIVEEVFNEQKYSAEKKGLKIDLRIEDGDYSMLGDKLQMGEAVKNLIDNSINYTPEGRVSVHLSQNDGKMLFKVTDTGVGITLEDMPNLFKAGGRGVNSLKVNVNATGYGLVFVRGVAAAHGGHVWAESEGHGKGSTFYMELPKEAPVVPVKSI